MARVRISQLGLYHKKATFVLMALASVCLLQCSFTDAQRVIQIGNELNSGGTGQDAQGATFLFNDEVARDGILYAFSAFIEHRSRMRFQVWRPVVNSTDGRDYALAAETLARPSVVGQREDFYIESIIPATKCAMMSTGDRLGIYFEELPWSVGFIFSSDTPTTLQFQVDNTSNPIEIDEAVQFSRLTFPYDFSILAYLDTDVANITADDMGLVDCPIGLLIPDYIDITTPTTTPAPPITGAPGIQGEEGPEGPEGPQGEVGPQGEPGNMTFGDTGATGPMGDIGATGPLGDDGEMGLSGYNGSMGATGPRGLPGAIGDTGIVGPQGDQGDQGDIPSLDGLYAYLEEYVANSTRNITDNLPRAVAQTDDGDDGFFSESDSLMYAYIWLAVLTLLLFIILLILIVLCVRVRRLRKEYALLKKSDAYSANVYHNQGMVGAAAKSSTERELTERQRELEERMDELASSRDAEAATAKQPDDWMGSMKPDQFMDYENSTIEREASQRRAPDAPVQNSSSADLYDNTAGFGSSNGTLSRDEINNY